MLSAQNALPDYSLNDAPEYPLKEMPQERQPLRLWGFTSGIRPRAFGKVLGIRDKPIRRRKASYSPYSVKNLFWSQGEGGRLPDSAGLIVLVIEAPEGNVK